jgi:hypothetical protein
MTLDEAKSSLLLQYQIDHFIDLKQFEPDLKGQLYNCLRKIRKESFTDQERIVFVAQRPLIKSYADQPHDVISMLEQNIQHHDIAHFFLIVLSNIDTIAEELEYVRAKYNPQENIPMAHILAHE